MGKGLKGFSPALAGILALAWLALTASLYFVNHKPFTPALAVELGAALGRTAAALAMTSVAGALGYRLWPASSLRPFARLALQATLGLGLLSLGVLVTGSLAGLSASVQNWPEALAPLLAWGSLLLLAAFLRAEIAAWWRQMGDAANLWREGGRLGQTIAAVGCAILLFTWLTALAPPVKFDALVYHLALPQAYLDAGRVGYAPENLFWGMPQAGEMLYTWAMALAGAPAAAVLGWLAGALALAGMLGYAASRFGARPAWISVAALLCGSTLADSLAWSYVDWFGILFGLGFLAALDSWLQSRNGRTTEVVTTNPVVTTSVVPAHSRFLILSGIFAGLALGSKYTAGVLLLAGLAVLLMELRGSVLRSTIQSLLRFTAPAALISLPWWVKNLLATGNPFYPFFIPSGAVNAFRLEFYQIPVWGSWLDLAFLPWRATFTGVEGGVGYSASIGPLLLGLAPLAWLSWPARLDGQRISLRMAALVSLVGIAVWAVAARLSGYLIQSRLYFSLFPAFALLSGAGFQSLEAIRLPGVRLGRVAGILVLLVFGFSAIQVGEAAIRRGALQKLLALKDEASYLDDNLGWYSPAARAAHDLPAGSRALMLWEPRSLYCAPVCLPDEVLDRWLNDLRAAGSAEKVLQRWQENGVTHLMYNRFGADFVRREDLRYTASDWQALDDLLAQLPAPADFGGAYLLYPLTTP